MGHGRKFCTKLRPTAPLIRAWSLKNSNVEPPRQARLDANEIANYEVRCVAFARTGSSSANQWRLFSRRDGIFPTTRKRVNGARKCGITKSYFSAHFKWAVLEQRSNHRELKLEIKKSWPTTELIYLANIRINQLSEKTVIKTESAFEWFFIDLEYKKFWSFFYFILFFFNKIYIFLIY